MSDVAAALARVRARIRAAAERACRDPEQITLVAVTKTVDPARIAEAIDAGVRDLGENRVQELLAKQRALPDAAVRWHMIGTLQRNKVRNVAGHVALIHSVDTEALGAAVGARARAAGAVQDVLVEVNTSGEPTKRGVAPSEAAGLAASLAGVEGIRVRGFMTMAAPGDAGEARASFRALREVRDAVVANLPDARELSMGMSDDLEEAVEEGATIVRVGTAIFGGRGTAT